MFLIFLCDQGHLPFYGKHLVERAVLQEYGNQF